MCVNYCLLLLLFLLLFLDVVYVTDKDDLWLVDRATRLFITPLSAGLLTQHYSGSCAIFTFSLSHASL